MLIEIQCLPVPWASHAGYGRRSFNPRYKEKEFYRWQIKSLWNQEMSSKSLEVEYIYHLPIPKGTSKIKRIQMLNGMIHHDKKPDLDNLDKFLSDCLQGICIENDSRIWKKSSTKIYSEYEKTVVKIIF
jgi:Holliday junction resolvase RusA-like endonuclease